MVLGFDMLLVVQIATGPRKARGAGRRLKTALHGLLRNARTFESFDELGEGREPSCGPAVSCSSVRDGLARACLRSAGVAGELPQERRAAVFGLWYRVKKLYLEVYWENFFPAQWVILLKKKKYKFYY